MKIRGLSAEHVWDYENGFYWFSDQSRLNKMLAHYELYKTISGLPGDIVELGVYKAASLVRFATFRAMLETESSRRIVGFDAFGDFPREGLSMESDRDFVARFESAGGPGLDLDEAENVLQSKGFGNCRLVKGNIFDTLPAYLDENPELRIALLHIDVDVKEPTTFALELLYERIVTGGLMVFDDYNAVAGETDAVDDFLKQKGLPIEKLPFYSVPAYVRKS